ncbi:MAG: hypothetical protein LQ342_001682 [Letrouitia transgressa]|nr:MAG: hypothetical protein LQ342_001682 [Letrouitia transgressa]
MVVCLLIIEFGQGSEGRISPFGSQDPPSLKSRSESCDTPPIVGSHSPPPKPSTPSQTFHSVQIPSRLTQRRLEIKPSHPIAVAQRENFLRNLSKLNGPPVTVVNEIDETSPSTDFVFLQQSILGNGVELMPEEVMIGCECYQDSREAGCLRCPIDLKKGQFIDTYRGEIITHEELEERAKSRNVDDENYFFGFDKFLEDEAFGQQEFCEYICDGMHMGGPTRFINHSCDPNCRLFTVSYNHNDQTLYDLAFFALEEIPAGTELTFDYKDEDDRSVITEGKANEIERKDGYRPQKCLCNSASCRGYFFN